MQRKKSFLLGAVFLILLCSLAGLLYAKNPWAIQATDGNGVNAGSMAGEYKAFRFLSNGSTIAVHGRMPSSWSYAEMPPVTPYYRSFASMTPKHTYYCFSPTYVSVVDPMLQVCVYPMSGLELSKVMVAARGDGSLVWSNTTVGGGRRALMVAMPDGNRVYFITYEYSDKLDCGDYPTDAGFVLETYRFGGSPQDQKRTVLEFVRDFSFNRLCDE